MKLREKLYFITLNYASCYILYPKLFECMFYTLNYDSITLYTLPNLDENSKFMMQSVIGSII